MTAGLRLAKSGPALARVSERVAGLDWDRIAQSLDAVGYATTGPLLHSDECAGLVASYPADKGFRSRVIMARHGFGRGEYKYFDYPLPQLVSQLRTAFYPQLAEFANRRAAMEAKGANAWKPANPRKRAVSTALRAYAAFATSAARGAVREVP